HTDQAAMNVTVRNIVTSMRLMSALDWKEFAESISAIDGVLRPGTNFAELTFRTRDLYRHAIEDMARGSGHSEVEIAQRVVAHTRRAPDPRAADPAFHLLAEGRPTLEGELGFRPGLRRRGIRLFLARPLLAYLGTIAAVTMVLLALPLLLSV